MKLLNELNACRGAKQWASGKTLSQAWQECQRSDWMLWLLGRSSINKKTIATIAVEFAEACAHNAKDYPAVAQCIAVVKRFLAGEATQEELVAAESSAWSAESAAWAARLAADSAESAELAESVELAELAAESSARAAACAAESSARAAACAAESSAWSAESAALAAGSAALAEESAVLAARLAVDSAELAARLAALAAGAAAESANCEIIRKHVSADEICKLFRKDGAK